MAHGLDFSSGLRAYPSWAPHLVAEVFSYRAHIDPECPLPMCPAGAVALTVIAEVFEVQSETGMPPPCPWGSPSHLD